MISNGIITVWHHNLESGLWERRVFRGVRISKTDRISKNGIKHTGFYSGNSGIVRIPISTVILVCPGDYVAFGEITDEKPNKDISEKIIEVRDNRRGLVPHYKIVFGNF